MNNSDKYNKDYFGGYTKKLLSTQSILDVFVLQGLLDLEDCKKIKKTLKTNRQIESFLLRNQLVTRETINKAYSIILKMPYISLRNLEISDNAKEAIPEKYARKFQIVPFDLRGNVLKLAITRPSDILVGFAKGISKLLSKKDLYVELFITSDADLSQALGQYKRKSGILLKRSTLPIVYLRNRTVEKQYLHKLPKKYIEQYRLAIFDKSPSGFYMVACEKTDSPLTLKLLEYIRKENNVELELFATAGEDIDFLLEHYENGVRASLEKAQETSEAEAPTAIEILKNETKEAVNSIKETISDKRNQFGGKKSPQITIDSIDAEADAKTGANFIRLRDTAMSSEYLHQLPKEFVEKYRVLVFGETKEGELMLATDTPEDSETGKAIDFIQKQHQLKIFSTSASDFNFVLGKL